jgi:hypothetical protein
MYELKHHPLAPRPVYYRRIARNFGFAAAVVGASLLGGVAGYHYLEHLPWIDALLDSSMIMGGMGPVDPIKSTAGKLFASAYALYCGLVLLITAGIVAAPVIHRLLHRFHLADSS